MVSLPVPLARRLPSLGIGLWAILAAAGCQTGPREAEPISVPPERYAEAFDAAVEAARESGLPPAIRDRSAGVIETQARIAGSLFEPWLFGEESLDQAAENTILFQRRRARIEFVEPSRMVPPLHEPEEPLPGATLPGRMREEPVDLTRADETLEVSVKVFVERAFVPGLKRSTYSRLLNTKFTDPLRPGGEIWTAVGRDPEWEARILEDLTRRLATATPAAAQSRDSDAADQGSSRRDPATAQVAQVDPKG